MKRLSGTHNKVLACMLVKLLFLFLLAPTTSAADENPSDIIHEYEKESGEGLDPINPIPSEPFEKFNENPYAWKEDGAQERLAAEYKRRRGLPDSHQLNFFETVETTVDVMSSVHVSYQYHFPAQSRDELVDASVVHQRVGISPNGVWVFNITQTKEHKTFDEIKDEVFVVLFADADEYYASSGDIQAYFLQGGDAVPGASNLAVWEFAPWSTDFHVYAYEMIIDKSLRTSWNLYRNDVDAATHINYPNTGYRSRGFRTPAMQSEVANWPTSRLSAHIAGTGIDLTTPSISVGEMEARADAVFDYAHAFGTVTVHAHNETYGFRYAEY